MPLELWILLGWLVAALVMVAFLKGASRRPRINRREKGKDKERLELLNKAFRKHHLEVKRGGA